MADSMNDETRDRINALCQKISVAHTLDPEIQEELRGHMEDKLLAYLNNQEPLTEDDAFLLVREHFGDPATLKLLMQDVHVLDTNVSFARRLAAVVAVQLVFLSAIGFVVAVASSLAAWLQFSNGGDRNITYYSIGIALSFLTFTLVYWRVLVAWEHRIRAGKRSWFQSWHGASMVILLGGLVFLKFAIPTVADSMNAEYLPAPTVITTLGLGIMLFTLIAQATIWLWWCDRPPRLPRTVTVAALAWLVVSILPWNSVRFVQMDIYSYDPATYTPDLTGQLLLWQEHGEKYSGIWALGTQLTGAVTRPQGSFFTAIACIFIVALAKFIYTWLIRRRQPPDEDFPTIA